jgi:hypothetical protein
MRPVAIHRADLYLRLYFGFVSVETFVETRLIASLQRPIRLCFVFVETSGFVLVETFAETQNFASLPRRTQNADAPTEIFCFHDASVYVFTGEYSA